MQIRNLPEEERPQEKMFYYGRESLSTSELVALLIRTGNREKSAVQLAEDIISHASEVSGLVFILQN